MATKLQLITALSEVTANNIVKSSVNWTSFLRTAAWNYKYPFHDQLLIYAQRPDATACAPIELWNKKLGRWVNRGAKGIALIDDSGSRLKLSHVFDVSDTNSRNNTSVMLWEMQDGYVEAVTETLENTFDELKEKQDIVSAIISAANNAVDDNYSDYLSDLMNCRENSFFEDLDDLNVELIYKRVIKSSVAYMIFIRCGYDPNEYLGSEDFQSIFNFNTIDTVSRLGAATSDISEMILREIGATVKELQLTEKKQSRTFAKNNETRHNESRKRTHERRDEHEADLHIPEQLSDTRPDAAGDTKAHRQIWDAEEVIPQEPQKRNVRKHDDIGHIEQTSVGDRPDGEGADRENPDEAHGEQPGTEQGVGSDGLDRTHEQPEALGGGIHTGGSDIQLKWYGKGTEDKSLPFFHSTARINFHISDDSLGTGGQKTKYGWNVSAIRLLNQLEDQNRLAAPKEQEILSRYVVGVVCHRFLMNRINSGQKNTQN